MVVTHGLNRLGRPVRNGQLRQRCTARSVAKVISRNAVPFAVEVHTCGVGNQGEDAVGDVVGLDVPEVIELAAFRDDKLTHRFCASVSRATAFAAGISVRIL